MKRVKHIQVWLDVPKPPWLLTVIVDGVQLSGHTCAVRLVPHGGSPLPHGGSPLL